MRANSIIFAAVGDTLSEAADSIAAVTDLSIDVALEEGTLSKIPIVSTAVAVLKIKDAYAQARLKRNVAAFFNATRDGDRAQYEKLFQTLAVDDRARDDFVDTAMGILTEAERPLKAQLLGNLIRALSEGRIDYDCYDELSLIIQAASVPALRDIPQYFNRECRRLTEEGHSASVGSTGYLVGLGLMVMNKMPQRPNEVAKRMYIHAFEGSQEIADVVVTGRVPAA